jgi:hypothetical protein
MDNMMFFFRLNLKFILCTFYHCSKYNLQYFGLKKWFDYVRYNTGQSYSLHGWTILVFPLFDRVSAC